MKRFPVILVCLILFSCKKDNDFNGVVLATDPAQYGTAYTEVPAAKDAVIYQVNMRAFSNAGNLAGVMARLDSIKSLGASVVYLMPIYPVGTVNSINSPYAVRDFKSVGNEFGTMDDLRALVDAAHAKNLSVMLDFVANHTAWDHPWITEHKSWYTQDATGRILSPSGYSDVAQLNFNNDTLRSALIETLRYWVFAANIDGYRFDFADNVPARFWQEAIQSLRGIPGRELLLFAEGSRPDHFRMGFDLIFGFGFYGTLKALYNGQPATTLNSINSSELAGAPAGAGVVRYISNHDINLSDGTPAELFNGINGSIGAFILAAYMNGTPMIYNGQETGYNKRIDYFRKDPINWTPNPAVTEEYKRILAFRSTSTAVRSGRLFTYSSNDVAAFTKENTDEKVLVLVNTRGRSVEYTLPAGIANGTWTDVLRGGSVSLSNKITLPASGYRILKMQ